MLDPEMSGQKTSKQKKNNMDLFLFQKYTAWKFTLFVLLNKSIAVLKMKFVKGRTPVLHVKSVKGIVTPNF